MLCEEFCLIWVSMRYRHKTICCLLLHFSVPSLLFGVNGKSPVAQKTKPSLLHLQHLVIYLFLKTLTFKSFLYVCQPASNNIENKIPPTDK